MMATKEQLDEAEKEMMAEWRLLDAEKTRGTVLATIIQALRAQRKAIGLREELVDIAESLAHVPYYGTSCEKCDRNAVNVTDAIVKYL